MSNYIDNIKKFDAYLNGTMSDTDRLAFEAQLKVDADLDHEFSIHRKLIASLQHAGAEADQEFENSLKHLSDQEMARIAWRKATNNKTTTQGRVVPLRKVYSWVAVAAAIVMIAGVGGYQYNQVQTRNRLCDAIFTAGFNPDMTLTRSGDQSDAEAYSLAISELKQGETREAIPALEKLYFAANDEMKIEYGTSLAYAYVKAHDLDRAWETITNVKSLGQQLYGEPPLELESLIQAMIGQNLK